jgi:formylglycine-generating enzyme required for sulfatase activity
VVGRDLDADDQPAVHVSWEEANNYCGWLTRHFSSLIPTGLVFRLPTEKEWETFARCGDQRIYPWGSQWPPPNDYNYRGMEGSAFIYTLFQREQFIRGHEDGYIVTAPIAKSGTNSWGLFGVGGNVWEWCADWFDAGKTERAIRGGAWNNEREKILRSSHRAGAPPDADNECIGFRVVIGPPLP